MALGCSTNSMLHLPAIAHEAGVELNMEIANEMSAKTPNLCHLAPAGPTYIEDLNEAGGVYAVMNELNKKGLLYTDLMTVTGKTVGEDVYKRQDTRRTNSITPAAARAPGQISMPAARSCTRWSAGFCLRTPPAADIRMNFFLWMRSKGWR